EVGEERRQEGGHRQGRDEGEAQGQEEVVTPPAATREESRARFARTFARVVPAAVVFGMFLAFSVIRAPLPAVNEPHFLAKAKHYWDPAWCPGDLFLDSADAHLVYFQAIGLVAQVLSLEATAWLGRVAG